MMDEKLNFSYLFGSNAPYIEELYEQFLNNPDSVESVWKKYFTDLANQPGAARDVAHRPIQESFAQLAKQHRASSVSCESSAWMSSQICSIAAPAMASVRSAFAISVF